MADGWARVIGQARRVPGDQRAGRDQRADAGGTGPPRLEAAAGDLGRGARPSARPRADPRPPRPARADAEVTAFSHRVDDPTELPERSPRLGRVRVGRPRPVHIAIPVDVLSPAPRRVCARLSRPVTAPSRGAAASECGGSARAGAHARSCCSAAARWTRGAEALALAERLGAPIGLTINGRARSRPRPAVRLPSPHVLSDRSADLFLAADVMLAVGTEFCELDWWGLDGAVRPPGAAHPRRPRRRPARQPVPSRVGSSATRAGADRALRDRLADAGRETHPPQRPRSPPRWPPPQWPPTCRSPPARRRARRACCPPTGSSPPTRRSRRTPRTTLLALEHPRSWLMPIGYGCLGTALPMAIGA